jgi:hypothetical protein
VRDTGEKGVKKAVMILGIHFEKYHVQIIVSFKTRSSEVDRREFDFVLKVILSEQKPAQRLLPFQLQYFPM